MVSALSSLVTNPTEYSRKCREEFGGESNIKDVEVTDVRLGTVLNEQESTAHAHHAQ